MQGKHQHKDNMGLSLVSSLGVCVPAFCASIYVMETNVTWESPAVVVLSILAIAAANFAAIIFLEHCREKIGSLTLPALLATVGLVLLFVLAETVNRFFMDMGHAWLFPFLVVALGLSFLAIFLEKKIAIKCQLGFNSVMLAVLWGLGVADKVALPF